MPLPGTKGIGLALGVRIKKAGEGWEPWVPPSASDFNTNFASGWPNGQKFSVQFRAALVRLNGPINPGDIDLGQNGVELSQLNGIAFHAIGHVLIRQPTCEILTKQIGVSMGNDISLSKFTGPGTTSDFKPFTVSMTCPTGINKLSYLMNGAGGSKIDPSQPGALSLSNANGASGVSVQVKDDDNKAFVNLGHAMPVGQYQPDQDNQHIDLKFEAAYIQTGAKVTGGEADAQATITMSYE